MTNDPEFRGVYPILPTPFHPNGDLDEESLRACVRYTREAGAHGVVSPAISSEAATLTEAEHARVVELVVEAAGGRVPVIAGCSAVNAATSLLHARHAAAAGADAIIAMPPSARALPDAEVYAFYAALASAGLPIWVQNHAAPGGRPMSAALLARMLAEIPGVGYVKEETTWATQFMTELATQAGPHLRGMMGGIAGRFLLEEYRRGACGTMPSNVVTEAHVLIWDALERGADAEARRLHAQLLPLLNFQSLHGVVVYKEILVRRGIIASPRVRLPGSPALDAESLRELDILLRDLEPLLTLGLVWQPAQTERQPA
jgi:dihydrodipicolinate synthase/N-acetylneuraminate lyase